MNDACHVEPVTKQVSESEQSQVVAVALSVEGMGCPNCAVRVRNSLLGVHGVVEANVVHPLGAAQVFYNPELASPDQLLRAVRQAGGDGRHEYRAELLAAVQP